MTPTAAVDPLRILIVEDEALLAMVLEDELSSAGHVVVGTAVAAGEAMALAESARPDLALVDVHLTDGPTGPIVARRMRDLGSIVVVFVTANPRRLPEDFCGALGVLGKPYRAEELHAIIRFVEQSLRHPPPCASLPPAFVLPPQRAEAASRGSRGNRSE